MTVCTEVSTHMKLEFQATKSVWCFTPQLLCFQPKLNSRGRADHISFCFLLTKKLLFQLEFGPLLDRKSYHGIKHRITDMHAFLCPNINISLQNNVIYPVSAFRTFQWLFLFLLSLTTLHVKFLTLFFRRGITLKEFVPPHGRRTCFVRPQSPSWVMNPFHYNCNATYCFTVRHRHCIGR